MNTIRLLLPLLFLAAFTTIAQRNKNSNFPVVLNQRTPVECGTPTPPLNVIQQNEKLMQQFAQRGANLASPVVIPIKAHIVRKTDGTGGLPVDTLHSAIAVMNAKYASINMSFSLCSSIHYIDSDQLYTLDVNTEDSDIVKNNVNDALNIYFVGSLVAGTSVLNGISEFPSPDPAKNKIIMWNTATSNRITLAHEMGHYWNLYHTHETYIGAELVNGSNCSTAGDLVCDTPADPCCYLYDPATCTYTGAVTDTNGQTYNPMVNNLMSYYGLCRDIFTPGQYARIDAGYALRTGYMNNNTYTMACHTIAALAPTNVNAAQMDCGINITWTDNANNEMGYIIEASTISSGQFVAVGTVAANVTSFSDLRQLESGTTYYYRVVPANSNANYSSVVQIHFNGSVNCYCVPPAQNCTDSDAITNVKIQTGVGTIMNFSSTCSTGGYSVDSTALPTLRNGTTYTLSLSTVSTYEEGAAVWIDFNRNSTFENSELVFTKTSEIWTDASGTFTVPLSAMAGPTRMRVRLSYGVVPSDACSTPTGSDDYGETEDYWINITCGVINSVTGATRCGSGSVTLNATGCAGGTINWYNVGTGGTAIATGGTFATTNLSSTTTYYVICESPCSAERTAVTATIIPTSISFSNASEPAGTFQATQTITSMTNVASGTNYFAGKSILLNPGFQAGTSEVFTASIQNISCP